MKKWLIVLSIVGVLGWLMFYPPEPVFNKMLDFERQRHGVEHKTTEIDGVTWHYLEGGDTSNPTVVLVHGYGADKDNWMRFSKYLVDDYHVIAPDLQGFGESVRDMEGDYTLGTQASRIRGLIKHLGVDQFHMAGNSMGGNITALYATLYPEDLLSAGLLNAAGVKERNESPRMKAAREGKNLLVVESADDFDRLMDFVTEQRPFIPPAAKRIIAKRALASREFNQYVMSQLIKDRNAFMEPKLNQVQAPTLVMWGKQDRAIDVSCAEVYHQGLPNSELIIYDDVGHLPMVEVPERSANDYKAFINNLSN